MSDVIHIVKVAVPIALYKTFDYSIHPDDFNNATIGARVLVPFASQKLVAIILEKNTTNQPSSFQLRHILHLIDESPLFNQQSMQLLQWAAEYYQYPIGEVFHAALPAYLRQGKSTETAHYKWQAILPPEKSLRLTEKQQRAFDFLTQFKDGATEDILQFHNITNATLQQLVKKQCIEHVENNDLPNSQQIQLAEPALQANSEQQHAIQTILNSKNSYQGFLLDGITGSGKTEVYLQVMYEILKNGKQVLVLVPEIGLTPQTVARFQTRFNAPIAILHSGLKDAQRYFAWLNAQSGKTQIILGTRSAIFTPLPNLGLIILDEEHDLSYKQQDSFRYHARDVALYRAYLQQCPVILGSATPSIDSYYLVQQKKLTHLQLNQRAGSAVLPQIFTIDLTIKKKKYGLSLEIIEKIKQHLSKNEQVLIYLNRRGYAPILFCESCGWQADCPHCDAHFTIHSHPYTYLQCHHCGLIQTFPQSCPSCNNYQTLKPLGMGTSKLEQHLQELFPNTPILRIDRDSTSKAGSWDHIYQEVNKHQPLILLGTQMLAKGHHFPCVNLAIILDADAGFFSSDFRAPERTAQQILQVAGRAGRELKQGQVYLQTYKPDHPVLKILLEKDYRHFAQHTLQERKAALFPPYQYAALIRVSSRDAEYNLNFLNNAISLLHQIKQNQNTPDIRVLGPIPAPLAKKQGFFLAHLLLICEHRSAFHKCLKIWWQQVLQIKKLHQLRISLDIDPQEFG